MSDATTRVAWLDASGGSRVSLQILKHLHCDQDPRFECHAFLAESETTSSAPVPVASLAPNGMLSEVLSTYDTVIFNMVWGANATAILPTLRRVPGVLILHENSCRRLFVQRCFDELRSSSAFARLLHDYYGSRGIDALLNSGCSSLDCSLIEPIAALASALVVHSEDMEKRASSFFHGPILRLEKPTGSDDADGGEIQRSSNLLKGFVRDNLVLLQRRARLVAPERDALPQRSPQQVDEQWRHSLLRARSAHDNLERDPDTRSPEPFIKWSGDDLAKLIAWSFLDARSPLELAQSVQPLLRDRWKLYEVVSKLRWLQEFRFGGPDPSGGLVLPSLAIGDTQFWELACQLKPSALVRILSLAILQRPWKEYELDDWVHRVESGDPPAAVLQRFLRTAECRKVNSDRSLDGLVAWADEQALVQSLSSVDGDDAPEWMPGVRVHFGDASSQSVPRLVGGWYSPEPVGRWTNGRVGGLSFRTPAGLSAAVVRLRLRVAGTDRTGPRNVAAYCNGRRAASLQLTDDAPCEWTIPLNSGGLQNVGVVLMADRSFSPASFDDGASDARDLGIMLVEGELVPYPADENFEQKN